MTNTKLFLKVVKAKVRNKITTLGVSLHPYRNAGSVLLRALATLRGRAGLHRPLRELKNMSADSVLFRCKSGKGVEKIGKPQSV